MFICIEGLDGSGKTTTLNALKAHLEHDDNFLFARTPSSHEIRNLLLTPTEVFTRNAARHLFAADMIQLDETVVKPALAKGKTVFTDRWVASTYVYQRMTTLDLLLEELLGSLCIPDVTFFLVGDPLLLLERSGKTDHYESTNVEAMLDREKRYLQAFSVGCSKDVVVLNTAALTPDEVAAQVLSVLAHENTCENIREYSHETSNKQEAI